MTDSQISKINIFAFLVRQILTRANSRVGQFACGYRVTVEVSRCSVTIGSFVDLREDIGFTKAVCRRFDDSCRGSVLLFGCFLPS